MALRVFIVEDSTAVRGLLVEMMHDVASVEVVGHAADARSAIAGISVTKPHVLVLDIQLGTSSGLDVLRFAAREFPRTTVLMLSNHADPLLQRRCLEAGAHRFFDKSFDFSNVVTLIKQMAREEGRPSTQTTRRDGER